MAAGRHNLSCPAVLGAVAEVRLAARLPRTNRARSMRWARSLGWRENSALRAEADTGRLVGAAQCIHALKQHRLALLQPQDRAAAEARGGGRVVERPGERGARHSRLLGS